MAASPVAAQLSARADVSAGRRYVWHGLEGGAVLYYELDRASPDERSETAADARPELGRLVARWRQVVRVDLAAFNQTLARHGMPALAMPAAGQKLCSQ